MHYDCLKVEANASRSSALGGNTHEKKDGMVEQSDMQHQQQQIHSGARLGPAAPGENSVEPQAAMLG